MTELLVVVVVVATFVDWFDDAKDCCFLCFPSAAFFNVLLLVMVWHNDFRPRMKLGFEKDLLLL